MKHSLSQLVPPPGKLFVEPLPMEIGHEVRGTDIMIFYPDRSHKLTPIGRVLYHASTTEWDYPDLDGLLVVFEKYSDRQFEYEGKTIHVIDERDILAVIEEEGEFQALSPEALRNAWYGEEEWH